MITNKLKAIKPKDLLFVLLYAVVLTFALAILMGLIDFLFIKYLSTQLGSLFFWLLAFLMGSIIRKQYDQPHLLYSIITLVSLLISAVIIEALPVMLVYAQLNEFASIIFDIRIYFSWIIFYYNPLNLIRYFDFDFLITLLMIGVGTYLGVKRTYS